MRPGDRTVLGLFAAAVVAALAIVAWLMLRTGPASEPAAPAPPRVLVGPAPADRKPEPPRAGPPRPPREPTRWEVTGEVLGPDGAPVAGADVVVLDASAEPPELASASPETDAGRVPPDQLRDIFGLDPEESVAAQVYTGLPAVPDRASGAKETARGASGPDGKFRVETPGRGPYRLEARREGVGHAVAAGVIAGGPPVVLRLGASTTLAGRVVNATGGAGIEGALLVIRAGGVARDARSAADGAFSIPDLPPGKYTLVAGAAGFAPTVTPNVDVPPPAPLEVVLGSGFAVRITVTRYEKPTYEELKARGRGPRPPGPPADGAVVVLYHSQSDSYRTAVAGPDGTVRVDRLGAGNWRIGARREGYNVGGCSDVRFRAGGNPEESREIKLFPAIETPVRVTDESGAPVRNARVYTGGLDDDFDERHSRLVGRTDDEGRIRYVFDEAVPWKAVLWVVPEEGGAATKLEPEDAESGEEEKVVVRPGRVVQGVVTDQRGRPVKDAQVSLEIFHEEEDLDLALYAYTDAAGAYKFPSVPFGETSLEVDVDGATDDVEVEPENRDNPLVRDFKLTIDEE